MLSEQTAKEGRYSIKGEFLYKLYDEFGGLKGLGYTPNVIANNGISYILTFQLGLASTSASGGASGAQYIAVGTGSGTISQASTLLATELDRISSAFALTPVNVWTETATFGTGRAVGAVTECGNFTTANSNQGILFAGQNFAVVNKLSADTLQVTWTFTVSTS